MNGRQAQGIGLMLTALGILVLPGVVFNNLQGNGLINKQACNSFSDCSNIQICDPNTSTCVLNAKVGCQVNASFCQLQNSKIVLSNPCSVFTNLVTFNYAGFVSSFFSNCGQPTAQTLTNPANILNPITLPGGAQNVTISGCSKAVLLFSTAPAVNQYICKNISSALPATTLPYTVLFGTQVGPTFWNQVIGNTSVASVPTYASVNFEDSSPQINTFTALCLTYGIFYSVGDSRNLVTSLICNTFNNPGSLAPNTGSSLNASSVLSFALSLVGAFLIIFIGLGVYVAFGASLLSSGVQSAFGSNAQGTRQAFIFGVGLLIWFPLYNTFNVWFISGYLPYGLDGDILAGAIGIISMVLIGMFFFGIYFLSQSGSSSGGSHA